MTEAVVHRVTPVTDDHDTGGFWTAAAQGRLVIRTCLDCGSRLHLPKAFCHYCQSWNTAWQEVEGTGSIYSWAIVRLQVHPYFPAPYTLIVVELDDAPMIHLLGNIDGDAPVNIGDPVRVRFDDIEGVVIPNWEIASTR
jgi:uncharacterized OB-fold protein